MISADNNAVCAAAGAAVPATTGWPRTRRGDSGIEVHTRTRIKTEEKTKVVTAVWGTELIQFIAALAFLHQDDLKKGVEFILFFKSSWCKIASGAKKWIESATPPPPPPTSNSDDLAFSSALSFFYGGCLYLKQINCIEYNALWTNSFK